MAKPYVSQPLYHSIVLPVSLEHPTAVLVQDMSTNPHTLGLWNIAHRILRLWNTAMSMAVQSQIKISSYGWNGTTKLWNSASVKLEHHLNRVHTFAFSPNGELISDWGGGILEALKKPITGPLFSGDGRLVAAFAGETIMVWDTGSGKFIRALELDVDDSDVECYVSIKAAFRPDGKVITWALDSSKLGTQFRGSKSRLLTARLS
ncbi:hypothetical protein BO79DRAFT_215147 [Aspergillus costaricaensis CBS 115574]|uniref:Uncharacterized protein n=1 Tax=Aspergillus costaricaensis CBS 115574 TaxID=1448317 RepID=A0ACD1IN29_9EURO|nr:hypothetical protein BO79DRAFT_215147 [Aspergillus costaricaensis CBS 115574]RAK91456.1 hypothetical protein BO79DRAFT_215147 [Aspergillus costaricaensis CBS 115574]